MKTLKNKKKKKGSDVPADKTWSSIPKKRKGRTSSVTGDNKGKEILAMEEEEEKLDLEEWFKKYENVPPLYNNDVGELDTSHAITIIVDAPKLKQIGDYDFAVEFWYKCRQKRSLELFYHMGDPKMGGICACEGKRLNKEDAELANVAISKYQEVNKGEKLKLRDLMKVDSIMGPGVIFFLTFSAENESTGVIKVYQAALAELEDDDYLLGLFRELTTNKTLAILSVSGKPSSHYPSMIQNAEIYDVLYDCEILCYKRTIMIQRN